jgi:hypothetical protein
MESPLGVVEEGRGILNEGNSCLLQLEDCLYVEVSQDASDAWKLDQVADMIKSGGVGVIPTDTM